MNRTMLNMKISAQSLMLIVLATTMGSVFPAAEKPKKDLGNRRCPLEVPIHDRDVLAIAQGGDQRQPFLATCKPFQYAISEVGSSGISPVTNINTRNFIPTSFSWSPSGHYLAMRCYRLLHHDEKFTEVIKVSPDGSKLRHIIRTNVGDCQEPCWLPDEDILLYEIENEAESVTCKLACFTQKIVKFGTAVLEHTANPYYFLLTNNEKRFLVACTRFHYRAFPINEEHRDLIRKPLINLDELNVCDITVSRSLLFSAYLTIDNTPSRDDESDGSTSSSSDESDDDRTASNGDESDDENNETPPTDIHILDALTGKHLCTVNGERPSFNPQNPYLMLYLKGAKLYLLDLKTNTHTLLEHCGDNITSCTWDWDGMHILTGHQDGMVRRCLFTELIMGKHHKNFRFYAPWHHL